jgi:short-subunit dehydrogenase
MTPVPSVVPIRAWHLLLAGAGGEVGRRLIAALAVDGSRLTLVGSEAAALARLAREAERAGARTLALPSAGPAGAVDAAALVRKATERFGPIDCLVNAGAIGLSDPPFCEPNAADEMLEANLAQPIRLTRAVLPGMLQRRRGRIVNVGSVFGAVALPGLAVYSASIAGLRSFSEALRRELEDSGVGVAYVGPCHAHGAEDEDSIEAIAAGLGLELDGPELAAAAVLAALDERGTADLAAWSERLIGPLNAAFPALVDRLVARRRRRIRLATTAPGGKPAGASEGEPGTEAGRVIPIRPGKGGRGAGFTP